MRDRRDLRDRLDRRLPPIWAFGSTTREFGDVFLGPPKKPKKPLEAGAVSLDAGAVSFGAGVLDANGFNELNELIENPPLRFRRVGAIH